MLFKEPPQGNKFFDLHCAFFASCPRSGRFCPSLPLVVPFVLTWFRFEFHCRFCTFNFCCFYSPAFSFLVTSARDGGAALSLDCGEGHAEFANGASVTCFCSYFLPPALPLVSFMTVALVHSPLFAPHEIRLNLVEFPGGSSCVGWRFPS